MSHAPYGRPAVDPPKIEKGQLVEVSNLTYQIAEGQYGKQYQIDGELENGFMVRAWVKKYDKPTVKTKIYKICALADGLYGDYSNTIEEALTRLVNHGKIYFECTGHRQVEDKSYPKFSVHEDKLPKLEKTPITPTKLPTQTRPEMKFVKLRNLILSVKPALTETTVKNLIEGEIYKSQGELNEYTALLHVAKNLGIDLEAAGIAVN